MKNHLLTAVLAAILVLVFSPRAYAESVRALAPPLDSARGELRVGEVGPVAGGVKNLEAQDTIAGLETEISFDAYPGTYDVTVISPQGLSEQHVVEVSGKGQGTLSLSPTQAGEYTVRVQGKEVRFRVFASSVNAERSEIRLPRTELAPGESVRGELLLQDRYGNSISGWPSVIVSTGEGTVSTESERTDDTGLLAFTFSSPRAGESDLFALNPITGEQVGPKVRVIVGDATFTDSFSAFADPSSPYRQTLPRRIVAAGGDSKPSTGEKAVNLLASLLKRMAELEEEEVQGDRGLLSLVHHFEFDKAQMPKVIEREQPFDIHLIAKREDGGVDTSFVGEVEIVSAADDGAQLRKTVTFLASDRGRKKLVLGGTLTQVGKQNIIARLLDDPQVRGEYEILVVARPAEMPLLQNLTIREPSNGSEISSFSVVLRGDAPPYVDLQAVVNGEVVEQFSSLSEEEATASGYGYEVTVDLPKGATEFEIFVEQVGGLELTSNVVQVQLDTRKPDILSISLEPLQVVPGEQVRIRLRTELNALVEVALEGATTELSAVSEGIPSGEEPVGLVTYEGTIAAPASPGEYLLMFFATDIASNRAIAEETLTVVPPPPGAPQGLRAVLEGLDAVFTWEPVGGAKGYRIYFGTDALSLDRSLGLDAPTPKARVKNLERSRSYAFVVTAIGDDDRESERSNLVTVTLPSELEYLTVTPVRDSVEVRWGDNVPGDPVSVRVEYGLAEGSYSESRLVPYSLMGATLGDLIGGIAYFFSVSFLDAAGQAVMSPARFQVTPVTGPEGFHPAAAEEISLPLPFLTSAPTPGISLPFDVSPQQRLSRPPENFATGPVGILSLVLFLAAAAAVAIVLRLRKLHSREQRFLLMMAQSYGSMGSFDSVPHD